MDDDFYQCSDDWDVFTDHSYDDFDSDPCDVYYQQPPYDPHTSPGYELTRPQSLPTPDPTPTQTAPPVNLQEVYPGLYYGSVSDIRAALQQINPSSRSPGENAPEGSLFILPGRGVNRIRAPSNGQSDIFGYFMFPNCQSNDLQTISKNI